MIPSTRKFNVQTKKINSWHEVEEAKRAEEKEFQHWDSKSLSEQTILIQLNKSQYALIAHVMNK